MGEWKWYVFITSELDVRGHFEIKLPSFVCIRGEQRCDRLSKYIYYGLRYNFRRKPRGGVERMQMEELVNMVSSFTFCGGHDKWTWKLDGEVKFR